MAEDPKPWVEKLKTARSLDEVKQIHRQIDNPSLKWADGDLDVALSDAYQRFRS